MTARDRNFTGTGPSMEQGKRGTPPPSDATIVAPASAHTEQAGRQPDPSFSHAITRRLSRTLAFGPARPASPSPQITATPLALAPGFELFEYRIESVLGQGGFGITYVAGAVNIQGATLP